jgi:hypothetical protein
MVIDFETYKLPEENFYKEIYKKTQIIVGHSYRNNMLHYAEWIYRLNGKNKKTATFTITKEGKVYQHYEPKFYSSFVNNEQDKASISIILENIGWLKKEGISNKYTDWLGNGYRKEDDNVLNKRWRNYTYWDSYTKEQSESLKELILKLCQDYEVPKNFIGHNVYDENVDLYKGIVFRSNYYQERTDVSPAFDMEILKKI